MEAINHLEDAQLLHLLKGGNRLAFNEIYNRYWQKLYNYTYHILKDIGVTEDIIQELFIKLWVNRETVNVENLKSYLFNACRNNAISQLRKVRLSPMQEEIISALEIAPEVEMNLSMDDLKNNIDVCSSTLPGRCRQIFYMSRFDELSIQEIAQKLNISHRTVENQLTIALRHLRANLRDSVYLALILLCTF